MDQAAGRPRFPGAHLLLPCRHESAATVRKLLRRDLLRWGVAEEVADAVLLASSEAVSNAVVQDRGRQGVLVVHWNLDATGLFRLALQARSASAEPSRMALSRRAHPSAGSGRSLSMLQALMDRVVIDSCLSGTRILLEKLLDGAVAG